MKPLNLCAALAMFAIPSLAFASGGSAGVGFALGLYGLGLGIVMYLISSLFRKNLKIKKGFRVAGKIFLFIGAFYFSFFVYALGRMILKS